MKRRSKRCHDAMTLAAFGRKPARRPDRKSTTTLKDFLARVEQMSQDRSTIAHPKKGE